METDTLKSTSDIAKTLEVPETTLRTWVKEFDVPAHKKAGRLRFDSDAQTVLAVIKRLRDENRTTDTIRKRIFVEPEPISDETATELPPLHQTMPISDEMETNKQRPNELVVSIQQAIKASMAEESQIAEKYARAAYSVGQLEERVKTLEAENVSLKSNLNLLKDSASQTDELKQRINELETKLRQTEQEKDSLEQKTSQSLWDKIKAVFR